MDKFPVLAASQIGVQPIRSVLLSSKDDASVLLRRYSTTSLHPQKLATARVFLPFESCMHKSAPCFSKSSAIDGRFRSQATIRGESPASFFLLTHFVYIGSSSLLEVASSESVACFEYHPSHKSSVSSNRDIMSSPCPEATATFNAVSPPLFAVRSNFLFISQHANSVSSFFGQRFSTYFNKHLHASIFPFDTAAKNGVSPVLLASTNADSN
mmetsp:Transcript_14307/g.31035  ORF Transcript_14307/g.31035 Transcript_14307/m.31035 type:complete len:212 (+) Transcript_14307:163-798(+)